MAGLSQVFAVGRHVIEKKTGKAQVNVVYGITSVRPEQAGPGRLREFVRGHWGMANQSHGVRDVTCDEDRSQVRSGNIPQLMASLCNTTIGLRRGAGYTNIAQACRKIAAQPAKALALVGIKFERSSVKWRRPDHRPSIVL